MTYSIQQIAAIVNGKHQLAEPLNTIDHLLVDSRRLVFASTSLFFALTTERNDGSIYVIELYKKGVRNFVVHDGFDNAQFADGNFIFVSDTLKALQRLAAFHRSQFTIPIIGITGSNGKTITKEWLYQLLEDDYNIVRSPKSYNSQIGVPLSIWQLNAQHTLGIFEAGISLPGEMQALEEIIKPTIGVFTNLGEAHKQNFSDHEKKGVEKATLFKNSDVVVYPKESLAKAGFTPEENHRSSFKNTVRFFSRSNTRPASVQVLKEEILQSETILHVATIDGNQHELRIPFTDFPSIDNALTCYSVMLVLGYNDADIKLKFAALSPVEMRMQLKQGINNCIIINDSYSNDFYSLELSLDYLKHQKGIRKTTAIVSEIHQSGLTTTDQLKAIIASIKARNIDRAIIVGEKFFTISSAHLVSKTENLQLEFYPTTEALFQQITTYHFKDEVILLKGARSFGFENISRWLEEKTHQTIMEVNLTAMVHNLKEHQKYLQPHTKVMAVVKAFSYGSGSAEVANILQYHKADYLAVAYADEGIELRKAGINMPIMVMNPEPSTFSALVEYNLEPELYSRNILNSFVAHLQQQGISQFPVHLKIDTGMHRLGFEAGDIDQVTSTAIKNDIVIKSVFSHLVASDDESLDHFTQQQALLFEEICLQIQKAVHYPFLRHLSNSAAIFRHPHLQYDMVRLGIGLYGVAPANSVLDLHNVITLKSTIAQIRWVQAGESVGYSRSEILREDSKIATVRIGYADGYSRVFSNGVGKILVNGTLAPVCGNVCMDMLMLNITHIENVHEGDEVEVFGSQLKIQEVARWANTIPYEIMTGISQRIRRVYYEE